MSEYRLRNHIPLGAPATRETFQGDEPNMRVSLGFTPLWYRERLGIDFSEPWHLDPEYRYRSLIAMKEYLHAAFPSVSYFVPSYADNIENTCATISGVHGIMLIPMLYGIEPVYRKDGWPDVKDGMHIPKERLTDLPLIDLKANPVIGRLFEQMDIIESKFGPVHGYLNYQGILNVAMKVRGSEIFLDMVDDPDFAHSFFRHIADTIRSTAKMIQARQRSSGFQVDLLSMSNCVMNMISPAQYEEFVLPLDTALSKQFPRFGIHTCNWKADPYLDQLHTIKKMGYLDTGLISDFSRIKRMFPDTRRAVLYSPVELGNKSIEAIRKDIERIRREYAPCDIVMADIQSTTPEERVREFLGIVESLEL